ncbi:MAG TPA: hypothetical protein PKK06_07720 [Phycisphaerae bacterium]|nr:hypothetical protein [Phycisphaerae bacterium]HNU46076.1 hypothetical protein [Phycisphaerae bacterium]
MAPSWDVQRTAGHSTFSGRPLAEGEEFYSALFEEAESFRRVDYALDEWTGPPQGAFCHFRTRMPIRVKQKRLFVDDDILVNFFLRLAGETEPLRIQFRFVLALILMRKKLLKYDQMERTDGQEVWTMVLTADRSTHRVLNPHLTDDQVEAVSRELGAILHGDVGEFAASEGGGGADLGAGRDAGKPAGPTG